ncbi:MAG: sigma-54-dependent Fis family transcriptional regulator, partial [Acidobacteria bacterium]|nr:sigma-54-dependent Fis family transcriptional regulator [Acidobacteriota bacterium]
VAVTEPGRAELASDALRLGAIDLVPRPICDGDLLAAVANAAEFAQLATRRSDPVAWEIAAPDEVVALSAAMRRVVDLVQRVAPTRCGVLIIGEPGTGRGVIARAIHDQGPRRDRVFVVVDGVAPPDRDAPSFEGLTGGHQSDPFSAATGGTLYIRHFGEMSPAVQMAVEQALDGHPGALDRRGAASDVRVVASAEPSILERLDCGRFRRELFERIAVVRIDVPPLGQRKQDLPLLAVHLLKRVCREHRIPAKSLSPSALSLLAALPWRGNSRELCGLVERLAVLVPRGMIWQEDVLEHVRLDGAEARGQLRGTLREACERFEREYVTAVLQRHRGRIAAAAHELGIERTNLYRKMKQLGISWPRRD